MVGVFRHFLGLAIFAELAVHLFAQGTENAPPYWTTVAPKRLTDGFSEDTPIGTSLVDLKCIDPEGDLLSYSKVSGTAVRVNSNGTVYLAVKLEFEQTDSIGYDMSFSCVDIDRVTGFVLHEPVVITTEISANDANDQAPQFNTRNKDGYTYIISEAAPVGAILTPPIGIRDNDRSKNAELSSLYLLCNSPNAAERASQLETSTATCEKFRLTYQQLEEGLYTANISLKSPLDYETRKVYSSKLVAIDNPEDVKKQLSTTINIQITVGDAQDTPPYFTNPGQSGTVSEAAQRNEVMSLAILARDGDTGDRRPIALSVIVDPQNAFNLTPAIESVTEQGVYESRLKIFNPLDREQILGVYRFVVQATELDKVTLEPTDATATATYSVFVTDVDDNPPRFDQQHYTANVFEMSDTPGPVQITGLQIDCEDPDEPSNAQYRVNIVSQKYGAFSISPDSLFTGSASLFLTATNTVYLDYDVPEYREQIIVLEAKEVNDLAALSSSCTVTIVLQDTNDNAPVFDQPQYTAAISESLNQFPSVFLTIQADDQDSGANGEVRYSLETGTSSQFSIDAVSGEMSILSNVDYEEMPEFVFLAYATDKGSSPRSSQVQVTVTILNHNDQGPTFRQALYHTSVNENSLVFLTPVTIIAVDDEDDGKPVTYRIFSDDSPSKSFTINPNTGVLGLSSLLSYEGTPLAPDGRRTGIYTVIIEASDNGDPAQTNQVSVRVTVIDQNNYPPVLQPKIYKKDLSELALPGTVVAEVKGTDRDSGTFGKITYRIGSGGFGNFVVNPNSGVVTVNNPQNFDFDDVKSYTVMIIATDGGAPQRSATATIEVQMEDGNNKPPYFLESIYTARVDEDQQIGTTVLTVEARDDDFSKDLEYSILGNSITARNADGALLTSTINYNFKIAFEIDKTNGAIYINALIDKEKAREINFKVQVQDKGAEGTTGQFATTLVSITVFGDINDQISFDPIRNSFMNEDRVPKYDVVTLVAKDPISVQPITDYRKIGGSEFFDVERATGVVQLIKKVDYEEDPRIHRVVIAAYSNDRTRSASVTVTVNVIDVNDNPPKFSRPVYHAEISENAQYPTEVATVLATDQDSSSFGPIFYRIAGGLDSSDFELFPRNPGVYVLVAFGKTLNFNRRSFYDIDIVAGDNENTEFSNLQLFSTAKLEIKVIDENNNIPQFAETKRVMAVAETAPIDHSIGTILATDSDFEENGAITYSLLRQSGSTGPALFQIQPTLGIVTVARSLIGIGAQKFYFKVQARDGGLPPNYNTMDLEIEVLSTEDNDGNPFWFQPPYGFVVYAPEETPNYVIVDGDKRSQFFDVIARTGVNITYALSPFIPFYSSFAIDQFTGVITVVKDLDREVQEDYSLYVYAQDTVNSTVLRTGREIIVRLTDENDNEPTFTNPKNYATCGIGIDIPLNIYVRENTPANVTVYTLKACDPDGPENNKIYYYPYVEDDNCRTGLEASGLTVEKDGSLVTNRIIDYEQNQEFFMCILASSNSSLQIPNLSSVRRKKRSFDVNQVNMALHDVAYVRVEVVDENDNGPKFPTPTAIAVIQTIPEAGPLYVLKAVDLDGRGLNAIQYRIESIVFYAVDSTTSRPSADVFILTKDGNAVYPSLSTYKQFSGGRFVLKIVAIDKTQSSYRDTLELTIFVYEKGQSMKVILNLEASSGYFYGQKIVDDLNTVSAAYSFTFLQVSEHRGRNAVSFQRTDVCFLAVDTETNNIMNVRDTINVLDSSRYRSVLLRAEYQTVDRGQCFPSQSSEENVRWRDLWWVLVAVAVFLFVYAFIFIIIICVLYRRYKRYMKTRTTYLVPQ